MCVFGLSRPIQEVLRNGYGYWVREKGLSKADGIPHILQIEAAAGRYS